MPANYERPEFTPVPKPGPRQLQKIAKRNAKETAEKKAKAAVMERDNRTCRICGRQATEVHEGVFKSLGGVASLGNSIAVCAEPRGRCHQFCQQNGVLVLGTDASKKVTFEMSAEVARAIFRHRPVPKHVRVVG